MAENSEFQNSFHKGKYFRKWNGTGVLDDSDLVDGDVIFNNPEGDMSYKIWYNRGEVKEFNAGKHNSGIYTFDKLRGWLTLTHDADVLYWNKCESGDRPRIGAEVCNMKHLYFTKQSCSMSESIQGSTMKYQFWVGGPREDSKDSLYTEPIYQLDGWVSDDGSVRFLHNKEIKKKSSNLSDDSCGEYFPEYWNISYSSVNDLTGWNEIQWGSDDLDDKVINLYNSAEGLSSVCVISDISYDNSGWQVVLSDDEEEDKENLSTPKVVRVDKQEEEWEEDPNYDDWVEKRRDPFDSNYYTKNEFKEYYGGLAEWNFMEPQKLFKRQKISEWIYDNMDYMRDSAINHLLDALLKTFD